MQAQFSHGQYSGANAQWNDVGGTSFDGLDRAASKYELAYGTKTAVTANTYDCPGQVGLLCSTLWESGNSRALLWIRTLRPAQRKESQTAVSRYRPASTYLGRRYKVRPERRRAAM